MPCNSDYLNPTSLEKNLSVVYGLIDEFRTGKLPEDFGNGYDERIYNKGLGKRHLDDKVIELCSLLKGVEIERYSLEMQIWWRDHQRADEEREDREKKEAIVKEIKERALAKLTEEEKAILGIRL
jgi:hypothetical protein